MKFDQHILGTNRVVFLTEYAKSSHNTVATSLAHHDHVRNQLADQIVSE